MLVYQRVASLLRTIAGLAQGHWDFPRSNSSMPGEIAKAGQRKKKKINLKGCRNHWKLSQNVGFNGLTVVLWDLMGVTLQ